jgi:hypothetical protein
MKTNQPPTSVTNPDANKQSLDVFTRHLNDIIRMYFARQHASEIPPRLPREPVEWIASHFQGMEPVALISIIAGLVVRGATPGTCGRYVVDGRVELPFQGCEQAMFDTVVAELARRDHDLPRIVQLIEVIALILTNIARLIGAHPESALNRVSVENIDA